MEKNDFDTYKTLLEENALLRQELLNTLEEKESMVFLCKDLFTEKEYIEKRYNNLKKSKLGRITIWFWGRRKKK